MVANIFSGFQLLLILLSALLVIPSSWQASYGRVRGLIDVLILLIGIVSLVVFYLPLAFFVGNYLGIWLKQMPE